MLIQCLSRIIVHANLLWSRFCQDFLKLYVLYFLPSNFALQILFFNSFVKTTTTGFKVIVHFKLNGACKMQSGSNLVTNITTYVLLLEVYKNNGVKPFSEVAFKSDLCQFTRCSKIPKCWNISCKIANRIVVSRNMCYYSGNQKFCITKSRLVTPPCSKTAQKCSKTAQACSKTEQTYLEHVTN